ncbi:MAG: type II secretion system protein [Azonexus sp.]
MRRACRAASSGITLIEVLVFIVVVSVGIAGLLAAFDVNVRNSADPMVRKQLVAVAESMLDEILSQPITGNGVRPAATQASRAASLFDEVDDYAGFTSVGIYAIDGAAPIVGLGGYTLSVAVDATATLPGVPAGALRRITVSVAGNGESFALSGYRSNYAE